MLSVLNQYSSLISAVANIGLLIVWVSYFQILLTTFRHQKRSSILITRGRGRGLEAECQVINMSQAVVYAGRMIGKIHTDTETVTGSIDDVRELLNSDEDDYIRTQAPLNTGESMVVGRFKDFVDLIFRQKFGADWDEDRYEDIRSLEITVIANYSTFERPVGARRSFQRVKEHGYVRMVPETIHTHQIRQKDECKQLVKMQHAY